MRADRARKRYAEDPEYRARKFAINRAWESRDRALRRERRRSDPEYRDPEPASVWSRTWRKRGFGSIAQRYERMLKEQNGVCALCKRKSERRLCVDHCHAMEMLRALLCHRCNLALGGFDDDPNLLRKAAAYLDVWRIIHEAEAKAGRISPPACPPPRSKSESPSIFII